MGDIAVIDDVDVARTVLDPFRSRILAALSSPGSSSSVADQLGEPRQKVNHHVRALEDAGLIELVEERPRRGLTERIFRAADESIVVAPHLTGPNAPRLAGADALSSRYLIAVASRLVAEVGSLVRRARAADRRLATLTIDADVRFATAGDRAEFTRRLGESVRDLVAEFHDESAPTGRWHRVVLFAHPRPTDTVTVTDTNLDTNLDTDRHPDHPHTATGDETP